MATKTGELQIIIRGKDLFSRAASAAGKAIQTLRRHALKLGLSFGAMTYATYKAVRAFAEFEGQMAEVRTLIGASWRGWQDMYRGMLMLLPRVSDRSEELTRALYNAISAGVDASQALRTLDLASRAATAGVSDVNTAIDVGTTLINAYGMSLTELERVYDQIFMTIKLGKTTFPEIGQHIGLVASIAAAARVPLHELLAMLALLTRAGVQTPEAITAIKAAIRDFASRDTRELLRQMGIDTSSFIGTLIELSRRGYNNLGKLQEIFPNIRSSLAAVIAALHPEELARFADAIRNSAGAMSEAADIMEQTAQFRFAQLRNAIKALTIELGGAIAGSNAFSATISALQATLADAVTSHTELRLAIDDVAKALINAAEFALSFADVAVKGVSLVYTYFANLANFWRAAIFGRLASWLKLLRAAIAQLPLEQAKEWVEALDRAILSLEGSARKSADTIRLTFSEAWKQTNPLIDRAALLLERIKSGLEAQRSSARKAAGANRELGAQLGETVKKLDALAPKLKALTEKQDEQSKSAKALSDRIQKLAEEMLFNEQLVAEYQEEQHKKREEMLAEEMRFNEQLIEQHRQHWLSLADAIAGAVEPVEYLGQRFQSVANTISYGIASQLIDGTYDWGNALRYVARTALAELLAMMMRLIARAMLLKATLGTIELGFLFAGLHSGGAVLHSGGLANIKRAHSGLRADEAPYILQRGEYVINKRAARRVGYSVLEYINRTGTLPAAAHVSVSVNISAVDARGLDELVMTRVVPAIRRATERGIAAVHRRGLIGG